CARSAGSSPGSTQPAASATPAALRPDSPASASKKRREKKWMCASETAISPHGVCIVLIPVSQAGGERELRQPGDVIDAELLHHGFAVAADGLQAEVEQNRDVLAGFALGHQAQHLQLARRKGFERAAVVGIQIAALNSGQQTVGN